VFHRGVMKELLRISDPVRLSWLTALLSDADIDAIVLDGHTSVMEGSAVAIPRRLCVIDEDYNHALRVLADAGEIGSKPASEDALIDGRLFLRQPENGFRAAVDPVLLAAAVPAVTGTVLDVGAGVGTAGLCYALRVPGAQVAGLELQGDLAKLARGNIVENDFQDRVTVYTGDLLDPPSELRAGSFDHVMANPPYMPASRGGAPLDPSRAASMVEGEADLDTWVGFCLSMVAPKGSVTFVHRADRLDDLILALSARDAGGLVIFPLWPGRDNPAKRVLVRARRGVRTPLRLSPGLLLHKDEGGYTKVALSILRDGEALQL
ncbi:MAG: putative signal transducing protein, partial [Alphaproteobacteria bacterium]